MTEYQEMVLLKLLAPTVLLLVIAVIYFIFNRNQTTANRILASSHSLIAIVGAVYAIIASKYTSPTSFDPHTLNFSKILAIAVIFGFIAVFYLKVIRRFTFVVTICDMCGLFMACGRNGDYSYISVTLSKCLKI